MTISGLWYFVDYILYIYARWIRVTFRRYGLRGVLNRSYRPRHAGMGYGLRKNAFGRAHGDWGDRGTAVWSLIHRLELERGMA